ncbi:hypothetical protein [Vibrio phage CKB-S1]|nr:hypothetical protein [Vibrio phage CKB-S1]
MAKVPTRLISRAEMARRIKNLTRSRVFKLFEPGQRLHNSLVDGKVDLDHPAAYAFIKEYDYQEPDAGDIAQAVREAERRKAKPKHEGQDAPAYSFVGTPEELSERMTKNVETLRNFVESEHEPEDTTAHELMDMTYGEIVQRYGQNKAFGEFVAVLGKLTITKGHEQKQARERGELIHRSNAEKLVSHIDALQSALLNETTQAIANKVHRLVKAGADDKQIERAVHDIVSRTIKSTKQTAVRALRDAT